MSMYVVAYVKVCIQLGIFRVWDLGYSISGLGWGPFDGVIYRDIRLI